MRQPPDTANRDDMMRLALRYAKEKLNLYRARSSGEYVGGIEHTALIRMIDDALASSSGSPTFGESERRAPWRSLNTSTRPESP